MAHGCGRQRVVTLDRVLDRVGAVLLVAAVGWTLTGAASPGDRPWPVVAGFLLAGVSFVAGRTLVERVGVAATAGAAVAVWAAHLVVAGWTAYPNADAAMAVQGVLAGVLLAAAARTDWRGVVGLGVVGVALVELVASRSAFGAASLAGAAAILVASRWALPRVLVAGCAIVAVGGLVLATASAPIPDDVADVETIAVRVDLWDEAMLLLEQQPWSGVGPGRFEQEQQVSDDADLRFAHSGPLQQAAEQGIPGLVLLLALGTWGLLRVAVGPRRRLASAVGMASLAALAVHASVDFILHFPVVLVICGLLVGTAAQRSDDAPISEA